jgi:hypothetical protein
LSLQCRITLGISPICREISVILSRQSPQKNESTKHMNTQSVRNPPKAILITGIGLLYLLFATTSPAPLTNVATTDVNIAVYGIISATPNLQTQRLTIDGNFPTTQGNPSVTLGNTPLNGIIFTPPNRIQATFSNAPATYVLTVIFGSDNTHRIYGIDVTIPDATPGGGGDGGVPHGMKEFTASGSWVVPQGVTRLLVEVWGAGGGGGDGVVIYDGDGNPICSKPGGNGAAGAYSRQALTVAAGDNVIVTLGQGGSAGNGSPGDPGGFSRVATPTSTITSGGGGGGPYPTNCFDPDPTAQGSPGTPDPNAPIGRASTNSLARDIRDRPISAIPASGSIDSLGRAYGGYRGQPPFNSGTGGTDGYVFIQW